MKRFAALFFGLLLLIASGCRLVGGPEAPELQGEKAPAFALPDLMEEKTVRFPDDFQNQPVMLIFFSPT